MVGIRCKLLCSSSLGEVSCAAAKDGKKKEFHSTRIDAVAPFGMRCRIKLFPRPKEQQAATRGCNLEAMTLAAVTALVLATVCALLALCALPGASAAALTTELAAHGKECYYAWADQGEQQTHLTSIIHVVGEEKLDAHAPCFDLSPVGQLARRSASTLRCSPAGTCRSAGACTTRRTTR